MSGRISAATERALARVRAGTTPYAAAKAEGIAVATIYRAMKKTGVRGFDYEAGFALGQICAKYGNVITAETINRISMRPDLLKASLGDLDLSGFTIPDKPEGWEPGKPSVSFWTGYFHGIKGE